MFRTTLAATAITFCAGVAAASTLGAPAFTTSEGTISFLNNFQGGLPSGLITLSYTGTIESAVGLPGLVGDSISFEATYDGGFEVSQSLIIDGQELVAFPGGSGEILIAPPVASGIDNGDGTFTFEYDGDFAPYGPRTADFPDIAIAYNPMFSGPTPTREFYLFCGDVFCATTDVNDPSGLGLTNPVLQENFTYTEGTVTGAIQFLTVGGTPLSPSAVPLPASGLLLLAGLGGVAVMRRKRAA